ncbi:MAG: hypothetical protein ISQ78_04820 [Candidatus Actinomarina sp.]|nr:hypothetical protein [Candidatus Actinomarina sp.]
MSDQRKYLMEKSQARARQRLVDANPEQFREFLNDEYAKWELDVKTRRTKGEMRQFRIAELKKLLEEE